MSAQTLKGPLTAFHPSSSCFNQLWYNSLSDKVLGNPYDTGCKPPGWNTHVRYSPALCPSSYYSADGQLITAGTVTETVIDCCPSSFTADPGTFHCLSPVDIFSTTISFTYSSNQSTLTTTLYSPNFGINAHSIQVRYQSSDFGLLGLAGDITTTSDTTASSALSIVTQSSISTTSSTSVLSATPSSTSEPTSTLNPSPTANSASGLSSGAKAGIGIGVTCGVVLVLLMIWMVIRARRSQIAGGKRPPQYEPHSEHPEEKNTLHARPSELAAPVSELSYSRNLSRNELPGA